ncbi:hypothetical protein P171DRAFT_193683 [Karstenula rhodostoma CBS 690.94]|uniref:Uncharacterized protein n=1 Tax=Karstenula rhodostoma CBS 690.94 TaxID=1392251 RepID=A0A9P4UGS1_9PLEO|nr:hypothetical protein P171DRAFT_193683 [Karstenula rhodostoma CBS 690.94]
MAEDWSVKNGVRSCGLPDTASVLDSVDAMWCWYAAMVPWCYGAVVLWCCGAAMWQLSARWMAWARLHAVQLVVETRFRRRANGVDLGWDHLGRPVVRWWLCCAPSKCAATAAGMPQSALPSRTRVRGHGEQRCVLPYPGEAVHESTNPRQSDGSSGGGG